MVEVRRVGWLASLDDARIESVVAAGLVERHPAGAWVSRAGDDAPDAFLVEKGRVEVLDGDTLLATLGPGDVFGVQGVRSGRRTASVRVKTAVTLRRLPGDAIRTHWLSAGEVARAVAEEGARQAVERATRSVAVLRDAPLHLADAASEHRFPAGTRILTEGDVGDAAWFVLDGVARAERRRPGGPVVLARYDRGQCFGERALIRDEPRAADVVAETDLRALRVDARTFLRWRDAHRPLRALIGASERLVALPSGDLVGVFRDAGRVSAIRRGADGREVVSTVTDDGRTTVTADPDALGAERVRWDRAPAGQSRELFVRDGVVVGLDAVGEGPDIAELARRVVEGARLSAVQRARFVWTGAVAVARGRASEVVCACVGVTAADVRALAASGVRTREALGARCAAGTVCGRCGPDLDRCLGGAPIAEAPADDGFERRLAELTARVDRRTGFFGPDSAFWALDREMFVLLAGPYAAILQVALPEVGQGVFDHSVVLRDPHGRFERTMTSTWDLVFGDVDVAVEAARRVRVAHTRVTGTFPRDVGRARAGDAYSAGSPEAVRWVAATLTYAAVRWREELFGPLPVDFKDRMARESTTFLALFDVDAGYGWWDWESFERYVDGLVASEALVITPESRRIARAMIDAPTPSVEPFFRVVRLITARLLPDRLRDALGLRFGRRERLAYAVVLAAVRATFGRMPRDLRYNEPYLASMHRLGLAPPNGRLAGTLQAGILAALRQGPPATPARGH
jgi:uncharacterized protein (DUF2236 family)/CRP-like cAMP-binding protein/bacterioferritin-associated ferredoxin